MDRVYYVLFGLLIGVAVANVVSSDKPQLAFEEGEAYNRFVHAVPALRVGDIAVMDDGVYLVVGSMGGRGESPLVHRVHPFEREEDARKILHGGVRGLRRLTIEDFRQTKELVRRGEPRWLEIMRQLHGAALQK